MRRRSFLDSAVATVRRTAAAIGDAVQARRAAAASKRPRVVRLDDVRRRLELLVTAVYDRPIPIAVAEKPKGAQRSRWTDPFTPRHLIRNRVFATTDGERIQLPREIVASDPEAALAEYRLMAIEQAERIVRGTTARVAAAATPTERDLYLLREGQAVDAAIARTVPGLRTALATARAAALGARPPASALTKREQAVEEILRSTLSSDVASMARERSGASPDESLAWAREKAAELARVRGRYRGIAPVGPWGTVAITSKLPHERLEQADELATMKGTKHGVGKFGRGAGKGGKQKSETGTEQGTSESPDGTLVAHENGPRRIATNGAGDGTGGPGENRGIDEAPNEDFADGSPAETESERPVQALEDGQTVARTTKAGRVPAPKPSGEGIEYPEWDWEAGDYREFGAIVRSREPDVSDDAWGNAVLARHGALVRRLRERFERLRARRTRLNQQRDGDELDLTACVRAMVDQRTGHPADDRLYIDVRPARRGLAISLLIDISGSTDEWIDGRRRVIDVEKIALLLASEALDALGDLYSIMTFSGKGRTNVRMRTIKAFDETNGVDVRRRMAALEPEGYTRAGAAIRHATAQLAKQPAAHRLLLILSDGKPNDVDGYEGLSGVEDTRQAINEARRSGIYPFCLTIDRQGQEYLGRIFGEAGHTVLRNPQQLPMSLVKVVKHLLAS
ncbi:MAG TPA: VWA domain-containing protein [Gemmatimonadaceae bacterium]|nr:VWA domain-containing protein [Gemmatimonadaceae bacterium]